MQTPTTDTRVLVVEDDDGLAGVVETMLRTVFSGACVVEHQDPARVMTPSFDGGAVDYLG